MACHNFVKRVKEKGKEGLWVFLFFGFVILVFLSKCLLEKNKCKNEPGFSCCRWESSKLCLKMKINCPPPPSSLVSLCLEVWTYSLHYSATFLFHPIDTGQVPARFKPEYSEQGWVHSTGALLLSRRAHSRVVHYQTLWKQNRKSIGQNKGALWCSIRHCWC